MEEGELERRSETGLTPLPEGVVCPDCGYDLRGLTSQRCPECGFGLEPLRHGQSLIPWSHRRTLGRLRAYWKTVWWVARWPEQLPLEMSRPVILSGSQSFRCITSLHAYSLVLAACAAWCARDWRAGSQLNWWLVAAGHLAGLTPLAGLPSAASCLFRSCRLTAEQQRRAVAISRFAWAPLAWMPLAAALLAAGLWTVSYSASTPWLEPHTEALLLLAAAVFLFSLVLWQKRLYLLLRRVIRAGIVGSLLRILLLNLSGLLLALIGLLIFATALYVAIIICSLS